MRVLQIGGRRDLDEVLAHLLKARGHEVLHCPEPAAALALVATARCDLVIVDIVMPALHWLIRTMADFEIEPRPWIVLLTHETPESLAGRPEHRPVVAISNLLPARAIVEHLEHLVLQT